MIKLLVSSSDVRDARALAARRGLHLARVLPLRTPAPLLLGVNSEIYNAFIVLSALNN